MYYSYLIIATAALAATTPCTNPKRAVEWREMSDKEQNDFLTALRCLRSKPTSLKIKQSKTLYEDLIYIHKAGADNETISIHNTARFLPWHRGFLALHDDLMQKNCGYNGPFPEVFSFLELIF